MSPQSDRHQANASTGNSVSFDRTGVGDEMAFFSTLRYTFSPMTFGGFLRRLKSVPFVYKSRIRIDGTSTSLAVQAAELCGISGVRCRPFTASSRVALHLFAGCRCIKYSRTSSRPAPDNAVSWIPDPQTPATAIARRSATIRIDSYMAS
jgi:hypothetical protein